ncbi:uncharacterized protein LOC116253478 [Nymphaea colorata]|nr:uncharacterized protein LOC116253478 [Nymphaea colorata]
MEGRERMEVEEAGNPSTAPTPEPQTKKIKMSSTTTTEDEAEEQSTVPTGDGATKRVRFKRRKIALFLAYCGVGYQGMQRNPGAKTIEGDLELALLKAGAIPEADYGDPRRVDWMRSARTDKGVSAVGQVVSGRFYVDPPGMIERLNSHLPPQIVAFGYKRVTASFNAKKFCDRRRYIYLLPVFALDPTAHPDRESVLASEGSDNALAKCLECSERGRKVVGAMGGRRTDSNANKANGVLVGADEVEVNRKLQRPEVVSESEGMAKNGVSANSIEEEEEAGNSSAISLGEKENGTVSSSETLMLNDVPLDDAKSSSKAGSAEKHKAIIEQFPSSERVVKDSMDSGEEDKAGALPVLEQEENSNSVENKQQETDTDGDRQRIKCIEEGSSSFHYGDKEKEQFNRILKMYVGTHNFHNLTTRTKAEDPSAKRYIVSFEANEVVTVDGIDFVKCVVVGQSFMLHQIRKMIGLAVAVMRGCAPESIITTALRRDLNLNVPTAPELGLFLDECLYTSYNQKWRDTHEELSLAGYAEQAEVFKMKHIHAHIASTEHKEGVVALWLHSLNHRNYPDFRIEHGNGGINTEDGKQCKTDPQ